MKKMSDKVAAKYLARLRRSWETAQAKANREWTRYRDAAVKIVGYVPLPS